MHVAPSLLLVRQYLIKTYSGRKTRGPICYPGSTQGQLDSMRLCTCWSAPEEQQSK